MWWLEELHATGIFSILLAYESREHEMVVVVMGEGELEGGIEFLGKNWAEDCDQKGNNVFPRVL